MGNIFSAHTFVNLSCLLALLAGVVNSFNLASPKLLIVPPILSFILMFFAGFSIPGLHDDMLKDLTPLVLAYLLPISIVWPILKYLNRKAQKASSGPVS